MRIVDSHKQKYFVLIIDLSESSKVFVNALIGYYKNFRSEFSWVLIDTFLRALVVKFRILLQEFQEREKKRGAPLYYLGMPLFRAAYIFFSLNMNNK